LILDGAGNLIIGVRGSLTVAKALYNPVSKTFGTPTTLVTLPNGYGPYSLAMDTQGDLFVGAYNGSGSNVYEYALSGGTYTQSTVATGFGNVIGLVLNASGNLYISDDSNSKVWKFTDSGGSWSGTTVLTSSSVTNPIHLAMDAAGDLYVANYSGNDVLRYAPGTYTSPTVINLGIGPFGLTVLPNGTLYAMNSIAGNSTVQKVDATSVSFTASATAVGSQSAAQTATVLNVGNVSQAFSAIAVSGAAADSGTVCSTSASLGLGASCVADIEFAPTIYTGSTQTGTVTLAGSGSGAAVETISGSALGGTPTLTFTVSSPQHTMVPITVTATSNSAGTITFSVVSGPATASGTNGSTITFTGAGTVVLKASQAANAGYTAQTANSSNITVRAGSVWLVDATDVLSTFDKLGNAISSSSGYAGTGLGTVKGPLGETFDNLGNAYAVTSAGVSGFIDTAAQVNTTPYSGSSAGGISTPASIAIDGLGNLWTANANGSVSEIKTSGAAVSPGTGYTGNSGSGLSTPGAIAVDLSGNVWVSNTSDNSVTEILGAAMPVAPLSTGIANLTQGTRP
jgi:hypothetical protein